MGFLLFASGAVAALSAPTGWDNTAFQEYPNWALRADLSTGALVELTIDPNARQVKCEILGVVGDQKLSQETCGILKRKRLTPATLRDGTPVFGIVRTVFKLFIPGTKQGDEVAAARQRPDVQLKVNTLPGAETAADVGVVVAVDEHGAVTDCTANKNEAQTRLAEVVCNSRSQLGPGMRTAPDGRPIAYVTAMKVRLSTSKATTL